MSYQTIADVNSTTDFGYETAQKIIDALRAAVYTPPSALGGSRLFTVEGTGYQDAHDATPFKLPDTASSGAAYRVDVWLKTGDASTTITPRIRNITDNTDAVVGAAEDSLTFAKQTLAFTPVVGKEYVLQFVKSDDLFPAWGIGVLRRSDS